MQLTIKQQIFEFIKKSKKILIGLGKEPSDDQIASSLALFQILKKVGKNADIVTFVPLNGHLSFLPYYGKIITQIPKTSNYVVWIDLKKHPISELSYETKEEKLFIYLVSPDKTLEAKDLNFQIPGPLYDLIFILDTPGLEALGDLYYSNTELFFSVPIVNIDHHPANENFAKINLVDVTFSSTCELILELFEKSAEKIIDANVATALLTGIISDTKSFQAPSTTPKSFLRAATLIAYGANHEEIIRHLYKTKPLGVLKLTGRLMSQLKYNAAKKIGWAILKNKDFLETDTKPSDIVASVKELIETAREIETVFIIWETNLEIEGLIYSLKDINGEALAGRLGGIFEANFVKFKFPHKNFIIAEKEILGQLGVKTL